MATQTGYKVSELGMIPQDWDVVEFGEVVELFSSGSTPSRSQPQFFKGNNLWITSGELNYCVITDTIEKISDSAIEQSNLKKHPVGTFLMAITGLEAAGTRGSCAIVGAPATTNQSCMAIYPNERLKTEFLYQWYVLNGNQLAFKYCQGTKQLSYTASLLKKIPVLLPKSTSEQTAIATALSDTDALISSLQTLIAKKKAIKLSAMQNLLSGKIRLPEFAQCPDGLPKTTRQTELGLLPEDWKVVELGEIGYFQSGVEFPLYLQGKKDGEYPVFKVSDLNNIGNEKFMSLSNNYIDEDVRKNIAGKIIPENAIIFAKIGAAIFLERKRINKYKSFIDNNMMAFIPCGNLSAEFLYFCFLQIKLGDMVEITALPALSSSRLKLFKIAIPKSTTEQTAIAQLLSDMDAEIEALECRLKKTQALKQGMMQALLTGKIRLPLE